MPPPTVTNQNLKIATTASKERMDNVGTRDPLKTLAGAGPKSFQNYAVLAEAAAEHTTNRTLFAGGNVIRIGDAVGGTGGTKSTYEGADPAPYVINAGGSSGPYKQEAKATAGAPNIRCEKSGENGRPARQLDATTQNALNSTGNVIDPADAAALARMREAMLKRCSLTEDEITCQHGDHKSAAENTRILEVVSSGASPEEIKFKALRKNAVEPGPPDCMHGNQHTEWVIHRLAGGGVAEHREEVKGVDEIVLGPAWLNGDTPEVTLTTRRPRPAPDQGGMMGNAPPAPATPFVPATREEIDRRGREIHNNTPGGAQGTGRQQARAEDEARRQAHDQQQGENDAQRRLHTTRSLVNGAAQLGAQVFNLRQFLKVFFWRRDPVRINVQSQACTGSLNTEILVFPAEEVKFTFGQPEYDILSSVFRPIHAFASLMDRIGRGLGFGGVRVRLMEDPEVGFKCRWKELTRDAPNAGLKKYQCGRMMSANVGIRRIIGLEYEFRFPIAYLLNFIPGMGWIVDKAISVLGIDASCGLGVTLDMGINLRFGVDEYFEPTVGGNVQLLFRFRFYFYLRFRWGNSFHAEAQAMLEWAPSFSGPYFSPDEIVYAKLDRGDVRIGFTASLRVSVLWWERNFGGEVWPESWRYVYAEQPLNIFRPIMALLGR